MNRLKMLREENKLFQSDVAKYLEMTVAGYNFYENGKREPSLALLVAMSKYFNVSINYLITGEEFYKK